MGLPDINALSSRLLGVRVCPLGAAAGNDFVDPVKSFTVGTCRPQGRSPSTGEVSSNIAQVIGGGAIPFDRDGRGRSAGRDQENPVAVDQGGCNVELASVPNPNTVQLG